MPTSLRRRESRDHGWIPAVIREARIRRPFRPLVTWNGPGIGSRMGPFWGTPLATAEGFTCSPPRARVVSIGAVGLPLTYGHPEMTILGVPQI